MSRFNLKALVGEIADTRTVSDPWGLGWEFTIARVQDKGFVAWQKEQQKANPIFRKVMEAMAKAAVRQFGGGAQSEDVQREVLEKVADSLTISEADFDAFFRSQSEGVAKHLLKGWSGVKDVDGNDVPFSVEAALELFAETEPLPEGVDYAGAAIGLALSGFLLSQAQETELFRAKQIEEAEGN